MDVKTAYTEFFQLKNRTDGTQFVCLLDSAPSELRDFVRQVHFDLFDGCLPNDWIYDVIHTALYDLANTDIDDINVEPDCYYHELQKWFSQPFAYSYCNDVMKVASYSDIYDIISTAQQQAKQDIYYKVAEFLQEKTPTE